MKKTIFLLVSCIIFCFLLSFAQTFPLIPIEVNDEILTQYVMLNEKESRLLQYKDTKEDLEYKLRQLIFINQSRIKYQCNPVILDIFASRVANKQAKESAINNFSGHWNMAGEKPYHRYGLAGGLDHIAENAASIGASPRLETKTPSHYMQFLHTKFMEEISPYDGHKKNIINPLHTGIGIGFYQTDKQFRYYEEFIDRYLEFKQYSLQVNSNESYTFTVKPLSDNHFVYAVMVYHETFPSPLNPSVLSNMGSYTDFSNNQYLVLWPHQLATVNKITDFTIQFSKAGLYYIHIYLDTKPYTSGPMTTFGKIQASGLIIKVQ